MGLPYQKRTVTTAGASTMTPSINLDPNVADFKVRVYCSISNGATVSYKLQYSLDPMDVSDANAIWIDSTTIPAATATAKEELFNFPVSRIRIVVAANDGVITVQTLQGFMVG